VVTCHLLVLALFWTNAESVTAIVITFSICSLLLGELFYAAEIIVAFGPVRKAAKYFHLIDVGVPSGVKTEAAADEQGEH
jgi:hypothetical protein